MLLSISGILSKVSERSWQTLSIGIAIAIGTTPIAATLLLINSGSVSIKTENQEFDFQGRGRAVAQKSEEKIEKLQAEFDELYAQYQQLAKVARRRKDDAYLNRQVNKLDRSFVESGVRLDDVKESQKEIEEFVGGLESADERASRSDVAPQRRGSPEPEGNGGTPEAFTVEDDSLHK